MSERAPISPRNPFRRTIHVFPNPPPPPDSFGQSLPIFFFFVGEFRRRWSLSIATKLLSYCTFWRGVFFSPRIASLTPPRADPSLLHQWQNAPLRLPRTTRTHAIIVDFLNKRPTCFLRLFLLGPAHSLTPPPCSELHLGFLPPYSPLQSVIATRIIFVFTYLPLSLNLPEMCTLASPVPSRTES